MTHSRRSIAGRTNDAISATIVSHQLLNVWHEPQRNLSGSISTPGPGSRFPVLTVVELLVLLPRRLSSASSLDFVMKDGRQ